MASDHIIYLTSSGNLDIFPDNHSSEFINKLPTPIILENNIEYEVGLVSILYPDQYYAILHYDDRFHITIHIDQKNIGITNLKVKHFQNILAGNIETIVKIINKNLSTVLSTSIGTIYPHIFINNKILYWNEEEGRIEINCSQGRKHSRHLFSHINHISITLHKGIAKILGFNTHTEYNIFRNKDTEAQPQKSRMSPSPRCGVDYIYLYTDIIQPSNFGGQLVNILDCFSLQNGGNRGIHNSIYKPLNTHFLDQISLTVKDQNGRSIHFIEDSTLTCVLHIRPK